MSDELIEKMTERARQCQSLNKPCRTCIRESLAILSKPENISWPMRKALWDALDLDRYSSIKFNFSDAESDVLLNQGIAAAIGSLIK